MTKLIALSVSCIGGLAHKFQQVGIGKKKVICIPAEAIVNSLRITYVTSSNDEVERPVCPFL